MQCIGTMRVFTSILTIDDTQIRRIPGAAVLNTFTANTCFPRATNIATRTTVLAIRLEVGRLNTLNA